MIVVEVVWLCKGHRFACHIVTYDVADILSILWVATGGTASQYNPDILAGCNYKIRI